MSERVHPAVAGFDAAAGAYEAARPSFPAAAVDWLLDGLGLRRGDHVLELGAGTGKLSRLLVERGLRVVAIEPTAGMRARLAALGDAVTPVDAVAERLPLADRGLPAAVAAQAFHWFDGPRVLRELERVLVPGGRLGLIWNHRDRAAAWQAAVDPLLDAVRGDTPSGADGRWQADVAASPIYRLAATELWPWTHRQPLAGVVQRFASISFVAALPDAERTELLARIRALVADAVGSDDPDTSVDVPYVAEAHLVVPGD